MKLTAKSMAAAAILLAGLQASAQETHSTHQAGTYPEACRSQAGAPATGHTAADMATMPDHQKESMAAMAKMDADMMQGMMKDDPDVAFVCGMIAHHQGAIDMANVQLKYGTNDWAKEMAQKVIDAQTKEIEDMTAWLKENAR